MVMAVGEDHPPGEEKERTKVADLGKEAFVYAHHVVTASLMSGE